MKLLKELQEGVEYIVENTTSGKSYFIEGPFISYDTLNENKRIYPKQVIDGAVKKFSESIERRTATGELNHPASGNPSINLANVSHLITSLKENTSTKHYIGKAKLLETPSGMIARNLLDGGVNLGVSTRGLGSVKNINGVNEVQSDFMMNTIDIVSQPSGVGCFVNGLMEGVEWKLVNGEWVEQVSEALVDIHKKKINEAVAIKQFKALIELCKQTS